MSKPTTCAATLTCIRSNDTQEMLCKRKSSMLRRARSCGDTSIVYEPTTTTTISPKSSSLRHKTAAGIIIKPLGRWESQAADSDTDSCTTCIRKLQQRSHTVGCSHDIGTKEKKSFYSDDPSCCSTTKGSRRINRNRNRRRRRQVRFLSPLPPLPESLSSSLESTTPELVISRWDSGSVGDCQYDSRVRPSGSSSNNNTTIHHRSDYNNDATSPPKLHNAQDSTSKKRQPQRTSSSSSRNNYNRSSSSNSPLRLSRSFGGWAA